MSKNTSLSNRHLVPKISGVNLALFDLDHTLLNVDSDYTWGEYLVKKKLVDEVTYRKANQEFYEQYIKGTLDAIKYNVFVAKFLTMQPMTTLHQLREDYIKNEIEPQIRPKAVQCINAHLDSGDQVVIISATNDFVVSAIAKRFGIKQVDVLATPLEVVNNRYTGKLADKPNFQAGKLYHLNKWLKKQEKTGEHFAKTYAYSDSKNDLPLLEWADVPVCVTPDEVLRAHALANKWQVLDWSI